MKPIIKVENLSKSYRIGGLDAGYVTFRETVAQAIVSPLKRMRGQRPARVNLSGL
jgi:hypothetical protein